MKYGLNQKRWEGMMCHRKMCICQNGRVVHGRDSEQAYRFTKGILSQDSFCSLVRTNCVKWDKWRRIYYSNSLRSTLLRGRMQSSCCGGKFYVYLIESAINKFSIEMKAYSFLLKCPTPTKEYYTPFYRYGSRSTLFPGVQLFSVRM